MHQSLIELASNSASETARVETCLTLLVNYLQFHHAPALTAGRTVTSPPPAPGTAPLTSSNLTFNINANHFRH